MTIILYQILVNRISDKDTKTGSKTGATTTQRNTLKNKSFASIAH
jgi:hypothetical protein